MMRVYAFLDLNHPPVAWAVMRGALVSSDQVPDATSQFISFMLAGMIHAQNNQRLFNELLIEKVRIDLFDHQVSRLRGMYFLDLVQKPRRGLVI